MELGYIILTIKLSDPTARFHRFGIPLFFSRESLPAHRPYRGARDADDLSESTVYAEDCRPPIERANPDRSLPV